ncbi:MAG: LptF/LptG family permease [Asticcacaulis sp.]|nr:LptF/LptG family permease [Asticcacaulis sp.]
MNFETLLDGLSYLNPWRQRRLENYILQTCVAMFASALLVVAALILLINYVEISRSVAPRGDFSSLQLIVLLLERSPSPILILLPFAFLFGALFAFVNLNRRSELIAMRAAGVSAWRFILPATLSAFAFGVVTIMVLNPVASRLQDNYEKVVQGLASTDKVDPSQVVFLRQGKGSQQVVIRADRQDMNRIGHLYGVTFWVYTIDSKGTPQFTERDDAREAVLEAGGWRLTDAHVYTLDKPEQFYNTLTLDSNLDPQKAFKKYASTQSVPFWRLPGLIRQNQVSGFSTTTYELKLHQLLSTPLMFAAMTALGAVFSLRLMRLGGLTILVISGVSLGFVIFFVNQLFASMGKADVIPAFMAGWSPAVLAMLGAMTLLVYTEDG